MHAVHLLGRVRGRAQAALPRALHTGYAGTAYLN